MRLKEINAKEMPPHPEMPDEHPEVLTKMIGKLSEVMGMENMDFSEGGQNQKNNYTMPEKYISPEDYEKMNTTQKQALQMRFSEMRNQEQSDNSIGSGLKSKNIWHYAHMWQIAPLVSAWASSVYTYRWWWWSHSYPASNVKQ
jgi:hypothetical protein